jgi:hypothetical protein
VKQNEARAAGLPAVGNGVEQPIGKNGSDKSLVTVGNQQTFIPGKTLWFQTSQGGQVPQHPNWSGEHNHAKDSYQQVPGLPYREFCRTVNTVGLFGQIDSDRPDRAIGARWQGERFNISLLLKVLLRAV